MSNDKNCEDRAITVGTPDAYESGYNPKSDNGDDDPVIKPESTID
jgi:hypothetical protein